MHHRTIVSLTKEGWAVAAGPADSDDQSLVMNVRDKSLVVLTGCGHADIVNIFRYAKKLTGVNRVYAVIGGFHLNGPSFEPIIPDTCNTLAELAPEVIVPSHCTGWRAVHALAAALPDAFIQNSVGTRFELWTPLRLETVVAQTCRGPTM